MTEPAQVYIDEFGDTFALHCKPSATGVFIIRDGDCKTELAAIHTKRPFTLSTGAPCPNPSLHKPNLGFLRRWVTRW